MEGKDLGEVAEGGEDGLLEHCRLDPVSFYPESGDEEVQEG